MPDTAAPYLRNDTGIQLAIERAKELLGDRLSTSQAVRDQHARGEDYFPPAAPDAAVISSLNGRPTGTSSGSRASHRLGGPGGTAAEPAPPGVLVDKGT